VSEHGQISMPKGRSLGREKVQISHNGKDEVKVLFKASYDLPSVSSKKIQVEEDHQIIF